MPNDLSPEHFRLERHLIAGDGAAMLVAILEQLRLCGQWYHEFSFSRNFSHKSTVHARRCLADIGLSPREMNAAIIKIPGMIDQNLLAVGATWLISQQVLYWAVHPQRMRIGIKLMATGNIMAGETEIDLGSGWTATVSWLSKPIPVEIRG